MEQEPLSHTSTRIRRATAVAHPNVALVKYWGKGCAATNTPAAASLSITLDTLETTTTVSESDGTDRILVNGEVVSDAKIEGFLGLLRENFDLPPLAVETANNFPTGAGLASSASGMAALVTAIDGAMDLDLDLEQRSQWARRGSASAARSVTGGFTALAASNGWAAEQLLAPDEWPLNVVVAVTSLERKTVGSTEGMELSRQTSPFYAAWLESTARDFDAARNVVARRDFDALASIAEASCLRMHAVMLTTDPPLVYWNAGTIEGIRSIRALRETGVGVFFTIDAGPQIKAVCLPGTRQRCKLPSAICPACGTSTSRAWAPAPRAWRSGTIQAEPWLFRRSSKRPLPANRCLRESTPCLLARRPWQPPSTVASHAG